MSQIVVEALPSLHINMLKSVIHPVNEVTNLEELAGILCSNTGSEPTTRGLHWSVWFSFIHYQFGLLVFVIKYSKPIKTQ